MFNIKATGGSHATGAPFSTNGHSQDNGKKRNPYDELGALGIQSFAGYIQQAYERQLYWPNVFPLYNRLRRSDPEISVVRQLFSSMAGDIEFKWEGPDKPNDDDTKALAFAESVLEDIDGGMSKFRDTLVSYVPFMGWGWWEALPGVRDPKWKPPQDDEWRSDYDDGLIGFRRLAFRDPSSFFAWDINDSTGKLYGMKQLALPNPLVNLPLSRSVHITFGDVDNPEGLTPLESVWRLERIKYGLEIVQGIGMEHAAGYLNVVSEKEKLSADDNANIRRAAQAILAAQEGNYATWPKGITGEVKDVPFSAAPALLEAIRYYGLLKLSLFNAQWVGMASISGAGSYSALQDASSVWLLSYNAMLSGFARQLDAQLGKRLFDMNPGAFPKMQKRPRLTVTPVNKVVKLDELGAFWTAIKDTMPLGDDDFLSMRKKSGFLPEVLPENPVVPQLEEKAPNDVTPIADKQAEEDEPLVPEKEELTQHYQLALTHWAAVRELVNEVGAAGGWMVELKRGLAEMRRDYYEAVRLAILGYLVQNASSTKFKNDIKRAVATAFPEAFYAAYAVGGGEDVEAEDDAWLTARMNAEFGFIDLLFQNLKGVKDEELPPRELVNESEYHAENYARTLEGIWAQGLLRGQKNKMLEMYGEDGAENCRDCRRLKGKRYSARKWLRVGIPGVPGNSYECGGYNCQHRLRDDEGVQWTP